MQLFIVSMLLRMIFTANARRRISLEDHTRKFVAGEIPQVLSCATNFFLWKLPSLGSSCMICNSQVSHWQTDDADLHGRLG